MRISAAIVGLFALGACDDARLDETRAAINALDLPGDSQRAFVVAQEDIATDDGTVYVVAEEHGDLHTYSLTPCGGNHVCGPNGRIGHVQRLNDHIVVTGAYPGRTFYLSPGGDGILTWRGVNRDLAWN